MNQPTSNNRVDDVDLVSGWVTEAGDPNVVARPEHVEQLRALLLDRLGPACPRKRWYALQSVRWLSAACIMIAAGLGISTCSSDLPAPGASLRPCNRSPGFML